MTQYDKKAHVEDKRDLELFSNKTTHIGKSDNIVKNRKLTIAIGLSQARKRALNMQS